MKPKMKPLGDKVLIRRLEEPEQKVGGIIIPDTAKEKPQQGEVVAVGPGRIDKAGKRIPLDMKKGQKVLFGKYSGTEITIDGEEYLFIEADDVMAILE
jgi:chaperonin GroES